MAIIPYPGGSIPAIQRFTLQKNPFWLKYKTQELAGKLDEKNRQQAVWKTQEQDINLLNQIGDRDLDLSQIARIGKVSPYVANIYATKREELMQRQQAEEKRSYDEGQEQEQRSYLEGKQKEQRGYQEGKEQEQRGYQEGKTQESFKKKSFAEQFFMTPKTEEEVNKQLEAGDNEQDLYIIQALEESKKKQQAQEQFGMQKEQFEMGKNREKREEESYENRKKSEEANKAIEIASEENAKKMVDSWLSENSNIEKENSELWKQIQSQIGLSTNSKEALKAIKDILEREYFNKNKKPAEDDD